MSKPASQKDKDGMVEAYLAGKSLEQASKLIGVTHVTCLNELKRRNISRRSQPEAQRKYKVDETFFDKIDTEETAYWLGFISADGCIHNKLTCIRLEIHKKDKRHLKKFLNNLQSDYPIYSNRNICGISINNKKLVEALIYLGVTPRKSLTLKFCLMVPKRLLKHYFRGLIDGDGCLQYTKSHGWDVSLVGSMHIILSFNDWVKSFTNTKANTYKRGKIFMASFGGNKLAPTIIKILYNEATVFLDRKMKKAKQAMKLIEEN